MKRLLTLLLIFFSTITYAQKAQKDTIKIAFLGDSFCSGGNASLFDSFWIGKVVTRYKLEYKTVLYYKLCTGGETTYKGMPFGSYYPGATGYDFYNKPDSTRNIEKVLSLLGSGDVCFLEYSGNDLWTGIIFCDSVKKNLNYMLTTLTAAGINYVVSGMSPRMQASSTNLLGPGYYTGADTINTYLSSTYPLNYGNIWDSLLRQPITGRMKAEYLSSDSVHPNDKGHRYQYSGMITNEINDKLLCNCNGYGFSFAMTKIGDSLSLTGNYLGYKLKISGSNDYLNFTTIVNYRNLKENIDKRIYGNAYLWYKIELESTVKRITKTVRIN